MAEGQVLIKDLLEATEVDDSAYLPIDDGELTKKISVENFNMSSNVTAKAYAEAAAASAQTASDTVANINQKVDQAQGYANAAQTQAGYASTYADNAQTYAGNAQGYANTASGHATNAGASASAASASADASADNALLAQSWVEGNTGAREGENTNNARYWANKAQSAAQITIDDHLDPQSTNPVENRVIYNALNDMHTGGSNIEITTTQTSLYGKDVTISDGTTTATETFDLTGKALFEGVLMTGDLTIESTDGTQTARESLTVPYFGNYSKAIAFWTATIAVSTTTTQFNGLTVSAKKSGAVMGTATFSNGSATITVPAQGTYTLEVTLDWKTYTSSPFSVTEETTYNETIDGFIAPISLTTPTSEFYGQSIAVTRNGVAVPVSLAFSNSGTASFTALDEGTYLFTLTYGGEPYTASVVVSAETTYSAVIKMWTATINITTASSQLQSQDIDVYKGSAKVATIAFNASGQASYLAHESGTYHFVCTVDGYPFTSADVVASDETVYSTSITYFGATLNISTSSSDLYSQTITIKKGSTTVGTTAFSAQGSATYTVHETGTYTCECEGYSGSATVSAETTYPVTINAGLDLYAWITAGSTTDYPLNPSSYADFSTLEADEAAVRQLMTVHASVDYLAQATEGDSLMQSVIGSDVCAKWINLSDYALDTLYANSDIADVMDTADKYGYGEWGITDSTTTPPTWGPLGNVPIMTANNAPYGVAVKSTEGSGQEAWRAFAGDWGNSTKGWCPTSNNAGEYVGYQSVTPICVKKIKIGAKYNNDVTYAFVGSNDGSTWEDIKTNITPSHGTYAATVITEVDIDSEDYYMYHALKVTSGQIATSSWGVLLQFYGRELKPLVPIMTGANTPKGMVIGASQGSLVPYMAFDGIVDNDHRYVWSSETQTITDIGYISPDAGMVKMIKAVSDPSTSGSLFPTHIKVQGSNDGFSSDVHDIDEFDCSALLGAAVLYQPISNSNTYKGTKLLCTTRQLNVGTNHNWYVAFAELQFYGSDYSEKEFAQGSTRKTIYDHGVELMAIGTSDTSHKDAGALVVSCGASSTNNTYGLTYGDAVDMSGYNAINAVVGRKAASSAQYIQVQAQTGITSYNDGRKAYQAFGNGSKNLTLDITSVMESARPTLTTNLSSLCEIVEWWLE